MMKRFFMLWASLLLWSVPVFAQEIPAPTFTSQYGGALADGANMEYGALINIKGEGDIYYTTDGTEPTTESTKYNSENPISLDQGFTYGQDVTIKAISVVGGNQSAVGQVTVHIKQPATLTVNPKRTALVKGETFTFEMTMVPNDYANNYLAMGFQMDGYEALTDLKFRKKGDGDWTDALPEIIAEEGYASFPLSYRAADLTWEFTVSVAAETDVEAVMLVLGFQGGNGMFCGIDEEWTIVKLAAPTFSPEAGVIAKNTAVTLSTTEQDAEIRYTIDGSEPTAESTLYTAPVSIATKTTLKAVSVKYGVCSKVAEAVYTLVAMPEFSASGLVERNSTVTLTCETTGATIYYTTDGSEPTDASTAYTTAITVDKPMTIKAVAVLDGESSLIGEAAYVFIKAPEFSEEDGSKVLQNTKLTLTAETGATIYYTTDGSVPTTASTEYTAPIQIERKTTIKAIAVVGDETSFVAEAAYRVTPIAPEFSIPAGIVESGTMVELTAVGDAEIRVSVMGKVNASSALYKNPIRITSEKTISAAAFLDGEMSEIVEAKYQVKAPTPVFTPTPGGVEAGTKVTIEAGNASVRYTTDGTDPDDDNNGRWYNPNAGIIINGAMTIKAYAVDGSMYSDTVTAKYWIVVATPVFDPVAGKVEAGTEVSIICTTEDATIYYTVDGSEPSAESTEYTAPIEITEAVTIKAIAIKDDVMSEVASATYTIGTPVVPDPVELTFDPASGSEVEENTEVTITANQEVEIFYMMFESEAAAKAAVWDQEKALSYSDELKPVPTKEKNTIKAAYALEGAESVAETFFYATYTVKELPAIELTFNPASGSEVEENTTVTVTASREVEIFYNLYADKAAADADTTFMATAKEVQEDGKPVITKAAPYLRCAVTDKGGMKYFDAAYTVKEVANEELELAGVTVYPNPSNGLFNIELPVSATIEVFMSNGMLYRRVKANAGNATLNIERSGIYFFRITGEGRTTIKRVVVR